MPEKAPNWYISMYRGSVAWWVLQQIYKTERWPSEKQSPRPEKWTKFSSVNCSWTLGICPHPFEWLLVNDWLSSWWKSNSPRFFQPQHGRHSWLWISQPRGSANYRGTWKSAVCQKPVCRIGDVGLLQFALTQFRPFYLVIKSGNFGRFIGR